MPAGGSTAILHELGHAVSGEDLGMIHVQHSHDVIGSAAHHADISVCPPLLPPVQRSETTWWLGFYMPSCTGQMSLVNDEVMLSCMRASPCISPTLALPNMGISPLHASCCAHAHTGHEARLTTPTAFKLVNTQGTAAHIALICQHGGQHCLLHHGHAVRGSSQGLHH